MTDVDGFAFTRGPGVLCLIPFQVFKLSQKIGMAGCLAVCSNAAIALAAALNKPIVGVHHMVGVTFLIFESISY